MSFHSGCLAPWGPVTTVLGCKLAIIHGIITSPFQLMKPKNITGKVVNGWARTTKAGRLGSIPARVMTKTCKTLLALCPAVGPRKSCTRGVAIDLSPVHHSPRKYARGLRRKQAGMGAADHLWHRNGDTKRVERNQTDCRSMATHTACSFLICFEQPFLKSFGIVAVGRFEKQRKCALWFGVRRFTCCNKWWSVTTTYTVVL